ncbi:MAG: hypothetical protein HOY79_15920 [Streptomyces sp.]|nr:hypothetical protein [Streptomyces sp.]
MQHVTLNNGVQMPILGFGVFQIAAGVHKSVQALETDIRRWIATWNTDPKPYIWTKTADDILERLAGYLKRIPDSED